MDELSAEIALVNVLCEFFKVTMISHRGSQDGLCYIREPNITSVDTPEGLVQEQCMDECRIVYCYR